MSTHIVNHEMTPALQKEGVKHILDIPGHCTWPAKEFSAEIVSWSRVILLPSLPGSIGMRAGRELLSGAADTLAAGSGMSLAWPTFLQCASSSRAVSSVGETARMASRNPPCTRFQARVKGSQHFCRICWKYVGASL